MEVNEQVRVFALAILGLVILASSACAQDCKDIHDSPSRLACFDKAAAEKPERQATSEGLDFESIERAMNARYATYFAHHKTSLVGSKTAGDRKLFYIRVPDPNPSLQILASCLRLDAGGWMCTLIPNYGTFGALPLPIKAN